jgi:hypothetical protein
MNSDLLGAALAGAGVALRGVILDYFKTHRARIMAELRTRDRAGLTNWAEQMILIREDASAGDTLT